MRKKRKRDKKTALNRKVRRVEDLGRKRTCIVASVFCRTHKEAIDNNVCIVDQQRYPDRCYGCNHYRGQR